jgi:hypothetical protein
MPHLMDWFCCIFLKPHVIARKCEVASQPSIMTSPTDRRLSVAILHPKPHGVSTIPQATSLRQGWLALMCR